MPRSTRSMRSAIAARTPASKARTVPSSRTRLGITLWVVPPLIAPIVTTAGSIGSMLRETTCCTRDDELRGDVDRVDREVGRGAVAALALDGDLDRVARRVERALAEADLAGRVGRGEVQPVRALDAEAFQHAVLDHRLGAALAFLGRLEQEADRAGDLGSARHHDAGRAEQHRDVAVVAAGVHRLRGRERYGTSFSSSSGSASMSARSMIVLPGPRAVEHADDAGAADPGRHVVAQPAQPLGHDRPRCGAPRTRAPGARAGRAAWRRPRSGRLPVSRSSLNCQAAWPKAKREGFGGAEPTP